MARYLIPRLIQCFMVIFLGITIVFFVIRLSPIDPVESLLSQLTERGSFLDPQALEDLRNTLKKLFGLEGNIFTQYLELWKRLVKGDFGPSLTMFPTPVIKLISISLPWTVGLLLTTIIISWSIGLVLGAIGGYFKRGLWVRFMEIGAMVLRPIPYYVFALMILILFAYILPLFPLGGGFSPGMKIEFSWSFISDVIRHAFLPALSLIIIGIVTWYQTTRLISINVSRDDYVVYAEIAGLDSTKIAFKYVLRNCMLPQITALSLSLGSIFGGALITEMVFSYPGIGTLLYRGIINSDYNLVVGIIMFSILAIAFGMLVVDLIYPLFDPRVRYK